MAMLSSYTTLILSRAPALVAKPSLAGAVQLRSRQPAAAAAAASVAALRWAPCNESRSRAALFACHATTNDKDTSGIDDVLENPDTAKGDNWDVMIAAQKDRIILRLKVGESRATKEKLKLTTTEDQARLIVRCVGDDSPASGLKVELTIPPGYDGKKAEGWLLANGWLIITIAKNKDKDIDISHDKPQSSSEAGGLPPAAPAGTAARRS